MIMHHGTSRQESSQALHEDEPPGDGTQLRSDPKSSESAPARVPGPFLYLRLGQGFMTEVLISAIIPM